MSTSNIGNQTVTFRYKNAATGADFSRTSYAAISPGIYEGGALSLPGGNVLMLAPFVAVFKSDTDKSNHVSTANQINLNTDTGLGVCTSSAPYITMSYTYQDVLVNYIDFAYKATPLATDLVIGKALFTGANITGIDYTTASLPPIFSPIAATTYLRSNTITKTCSAQMGVSGTKASTFDVNGDAGNPAVMGFNRIGLYAINFGLDTDNILKVGGWSLGNNKYRVLLTDGDNTNITVGNITCPTLFTGGVANNAKALTTRIVGSTDNLGVAVVNDATAGVKNIIYWVESGAAGSPDITKTWTIKKLDWAADDPAHFKLVALDFNSPEEHHITYSTGFVGVWKKVRNSDGSATNAANSDLLGSVAITSIPYFGQPPTVAKTAAIYTGDANNIVATGDYLSNNTMTNIPSPYGFLTHVSWSDSQFAIQKFCLSVNGVGEWKRVKWANVWGSWIVTTNADGSVPNATNATQLGTVPSASLLAPTVHIVTASRTLGDTYTNSLAYPITIYCSAHSAINVILGGVIAGSTVNQIESTVGSGNAYASITIIIPSGATYAIACGPSTTLDKWVEVY
jgi:hypothetical protein